MLVGPECWHFLVVAEAVMIRSYRLVVLALAVAAIPAPSAVRAQMGYEAPSLEWLVADSDVVVRALVVNVERTPIPNPNPETYRNPVERQTVTLKVREALKGQALDSLTFSKQTSPSDRIYEGWRDAGIEQLWFFKRAPDDESNEALKPYELGWSAIRLGPAVPAEKGYSRVPPPIFSMNLEVLTESEEILEAARLAVDALGEAKPLPSHEITLPREIMQRSGKSGDANRLTVPVDGRLEVLAHRLINEPGAFLRDGEGGYAVRLRQEGVKALRYFPSPKNRRLLRGLPDALSTLPARDRVPVEEIQEMAADILQAWALEVRLLPFPDGRSLHNRNPVIVRFTNRENQPIRILRPLDGSEWSWHMPYYRFTIHDADGTPLELASRCGVSGLWANVEWPDDYIIRILPGDSYEMQVGIPHPIPADGEYTVSFEYVYDPKAAAKSSIEYPDGLWEGHARSEGIRLQLNGVE